MYKHFIFAFTILFSIHLNAQNNAYTNNKSTPAFVNSNSNWAKNQLAKMSLQEKIGQLFMVAVHPKKGEEHLKELETLINAEHGLGGLIFFKGHPTDQVNIYNRLQKQSKIPMMIGIDGEWGLSMRLDSTVNYPRQMMLGALPDDQLILEMGKQIGAQCKRMGIHVNFAPVIDVNNNAANPVINNRSFGEIRELVAKYGIAYMKGMQDQGVLACGKHFPGHGDTDMDSHKALPTIPYSFDRLDSLELYPFKSLIAQQLASIMVAHLYIPELDATPNQASTLSAKIVNGLLRDSLGFEGLVFTDAMMMKGVSDHYGAGDMDVRALMAGNDIILFPLDVPLAVTKIEAAVKNGEITETELDEKVLRILKAKEWAGISIFEPIKTDSLYEDLNTIDAEVLNHQLAKQSITLIQNQEDALPLKRLDTISTVYLNIGGSQYNQFYATMQLYTEFSTIQVPRSMSASEETKLLSDLEAYDRVVVGFHRMTNNPKSNFGVTRQMIAIHEIISKRQDVITVLFGNPYVLDKFGDLSQTKAILVAYEDNDYTNNAAAQVVFGGVVPQGKLPVTASPDFPAGLGLTFDKKTRLSHVIPEEIGISSDELYGIDQIAETSIHQKAFPGCQIVAIKDGNVFYNKAFGYHTYEKTRAVKTSDIYDLASITKIASTTISLIKLQGDSIIDIDNRLTKYLPEVVDSTPYERMVMREMLAHQAGLIAWIPFYTKTLENGKPDMKIYSHDSSAKFNHRVSENLYISSDYEKTILETITQKGLRKKNYKYSDLGYYFIKAIIEKETGEQLENYVAKNFYGPMGLSTMTYHPRYKFPLDRITPTEQDTSFRQHLVWGDVHDPGAAMQGGVGGHAGLFSNALDLGTLMYMLINDGEYGGDQLLNKDTIADFTRCQFGPRNRRGAGFDKPVRSLDGGPTCDKVSLSSFGHSGFTGTITWADPDKGIVYVFLSNRVYPDAMNWKIVKDNIRTKIQDVIYTACQNAASNQLSDSSN
ncbi:serine hydrolase [Paracrocinitomix mangrovi]|uniref:glycoside hydrolase family 3 N-terminal domain-containing protein n=1 Tax=Paracrocinitomix mangrovi TaxID=2862509 RepID=UPI001C8D7185|nr:glycoside hydrolase family 3 N-terminal domain-containing protein [Paracrocinitomix mangrovi]UKN01940.1 serine hydrolase [Paracrocinitomix mangrovi]